MIFTSRNKIDLRLLKFVLELSARTCGALAQCQWLERLEKNNFKVIFFSVWATENSIANYLESNQFTSYDIMRAWYTRELNKGFRSKFMQILEFDNIHMKKVGGYIYRNVVKKTLEMRTVVRRIQIIWFFFNEWRLNYEREISNSLAAGQWTFFLPKYSLTMFFFFSFNV